MYLLFAMGTEWRVHQLMVVRNCFIELLVLDQLVPAQMLQAETLAGLVVCFVEEGLSVSDQH